MNNLIVGAQSITDNVSLIAPLGLAMLLLSCVVFLVVDRKHALWPLFIMVFFISQAQKVVVFSLDFNQMRVMVLVGLVRVLLKGELKNVKRHKMDYFIIAYALVVAVFHIIREGNEVIVFELGNLVDLIVPYIVFRALIQSHEDLIRAIKILSILSAVVLVFFINEAMTGRNMFSIFGGVPDYTVIRGGKLRCQGAFVHPIIAGVYFATVMPLFVSLFWHKHKALAVTGVLAAGIIIFTTASSTPVFAALSALLGALFFSLREHMMAVRWSVYALIGFLHMIMKAPVWNLIARVSATGSSDSWYRYMLINVTIHYFSDWWFIGSSSYYDWYEFYGPVDITDQFVASALQGGLLGLVLFIYIIALAFGAVGRMWRLAHQDKAKMVSAWALGCSLFALIMSFIGVSLWGQMFMLWAMVLAMIASMDNHYKHDSAVAEKNLVSPQLPATPLTE